MKIRDKSIGYAVTALRDCNIVIDNCYSKEFNGYISSLGAAIVQSGLLPAMIFFGSKDASATGRDKVVCAVKQVVNLNRKDRNQEQINSEISMAEYCLVGVGTSDLLREVTDAAIALKLALRMFEKQKNKEELL